MNEYAFKQAFYYPKNMNVSVIAIYDYKHRTMRYAECSFDRYYLWPFCVLESNLTVSHMC